MYAVVGSWKMDAALKDQQERVLVEEIVPAVKAAPGFVAAYWCHSADWTDAVQTFDDLLWSVQPLDALADIEERDRARPHLLDRVEQGMEMLGLSGQEIEETLTGLRERLTDISNSDRAFLEDDRPHAEAPELPVMEEIVLTGPDEVEPVEAVEPEPEMVREINRLTEGVWVEVTHDDGQKMR